MTDFFKQIEQYVGATNLKLVISKSDEKLSVSILPKGPVKDKAMKQITPLILSGTAQELDEGFFEHISKPLEKVVGIVSNITQFEASAEEAEKEAKEDKTTKSTPAKRSVPSRSSSSAKADADKKQKAEAEKVKKDELAAKKAADDLKKKEEADRKKIFTSLTKKGESLEKEKDFKNAIGAYKESQAFTDKPDPIGKKINELIFKVANGRDLFSMGDEITSIKTNYTEDIEKSLGITKVETPAAEVSVEEPFVTEPEEPTPAGEEGVVVE